MFAIFSAVVVSSVCGPVFVFVIFSLQVILICVILKHIMYGNSKVYIKLKCNFDCRVGIRAWHVLLFNGANLLAFFMFLMPHIKGYNYKNKYYMYLVFDLKSDLDLITSIINIFAWRIYFTKRWVPTAMKFHCINEAGHA